MECRLDSLCPEISCCEGSEVNKDVSDLWIDFNTLKTGLLAVICYLLYRVSQALIRWPSFIFSVSVFFNGQDRTDDHHRAGLSFLWSVLSNIVYVARGLFTILRWSTHLWSYFAVLLSSFSKISWVPDAFKAFAGFSETTVSNAEPLNITKALRPHIRDPGLRLFLLGTSRGVCGSLRDSLLGYSAGALAPDLESTAWRAMVDGREVTVVETPDLLGVTLAVRQRAQQTLRSLQLASPGPHAFLLVIPTTYLDKVYQMSACDFLAKLLNLVGEEAANYVLVVFTYASPWGASSTLEQLLEEDYRGIKAALPLCGNRVELVNISPSRSMDSRMAEGRRLLDRVVDMRAKKGHYIHEFQRQEDEVRTQLLNDMAFQLAKKLDGKGK